MGCWARKADGAGVGLKGSVTSMIVLLWANVQESPFLQLFLVQCLHCMGPNMVPVGSLYRWSSVGPWAYLQSWFWHVPLMLFWQIAILKWVLVAFEMCDWGVLACLAAEELRLGGWKFWLDDLLLAEPDA